MPAHSLYRRAIPAAARVGCWQAPDGWSHRRFDWAAPERHRRGAILFQGGRGDVFEKYLEAFSHWHARGWSVTSFDWRGQGGSGRLGPDPHCGHIGSFDSFVDDLSAFSAEWRSDNPGPHVIIGHSMGGHIALRALAERRVVTDGAVLVAPMLGLRAPGGARVGERLARLLASLGARTRPAWKGNERPHTRATRQTLLTFDPERYADELWWQETHPDHRTGPPSWGWVVDAFRSTRELRGNPALAELAVPILMLVADADALVDPAAALAIAERLPNVTLERFGSEARHELLREADAVRNRALGAIDDYLMRWKPPR